MDISNERSSIQIYRRTMNKLNKLKQTPSQTYDDVILQLIRFYELKGRGPLPKLKPEEAFA